MKEETFKLLNEKDLEVWRFEEIENILANNMIYNQDKMIIDIMEIKEI